MKSFDLGLYGTISSAISFAAQLIQSGLLSSNSKIPIADNQSNTVAILQIVLLSLTVFIGFAFATIPRRPVVFKDSKPIDGAFTVSALGRYTFSWVNPLVSLAKIKSKNNEQLDMEDLPVPNHLTRSRDLSEGWSSCERTGSLWWEMIKEHRWTFAAQWFLTLLGAIGTFAPPFVLLHILQLLEQRQVGEDIGYRAWVWVFAVS